MLLGKESGKLELFDAVNYLHVSITNRNKKWRERDLDMDGRSQEEWRPLGFSRKGKMRSEKWKEEGLASREAPI